MLVHSYRAVARGIAARVPRSKTDQLVQLSAILSRAARLNVSASTCTPSIASLKAISAILQGHRTYATAAAKAKTTRAKKATTSTKKAPKAAKKTTTKKAKPKSTKGKKRSAAAKKKTVRRPAKKTKAKAKSKAKAKAPKRPLKKDLTTEEKEKLEIKKLRALTLHNQEPKRKPATVWGVISQEMAAANKRLSTKEASQKYRSLTPEQMEHYNHVANTNKAANDANRKKWIESHTPDEMRVANNARKLLHTKYPKKFGKTIRDRIRDDRKPKPQQSAYKLFSVERLKSGDFNHMSGRVSFPLVASEWRALGAREKEEYNRRAAADRARYLEEVRTVFKRDSMDPHKHTAT